MEIKRMRLTLTQNRTWSVFYYVTPVYQILKRVNSFKSCHLENNKRLTALFFSIFSNGDYGSRAPKIEIDPCTKYYLNVCTLLSSVIYLETICYIFRNSDLDPLPEGIQNRTRLVFYDVTCVYQILFKCTCINSFKSYHLETNSGHWFYF